tara:strand:- start:1450 stop:1749 length:300 start_codon:yes stop_codon:yes gene_type:complete
MLRNQEGQKVKLETYNDLFYPNNYFLRNISNTRTVLAVGQYHARCLENVAKIRSYRPDLEVRKILELAVNQSQGKHYSTETRLLHFLEFVKEGKELPNG